MSYVLDIRMRALVLNTPLQPAHFATEPTLFYMIHCDMALYEAVLRENESNLEHILLAGNRLHHYVEK